MIRPPARYSAAAALGSWRPAGRRQSTVESADLIDLFDQKKIRPDSRNECTWLGIRFAKACKSRRHVVAPIRPLSRATYHAIVAISAVPFRPVGGPFPGRLGSRPSNARLLSPPCKQDQIAVRVADDERPVAPGFRFERLREKDAGGLIFKEQ